MTRAREDYLRFFPHSAINFLSSTSSSSSFSVCFNNGHSTIKTYISQTLNVTFIKLVKLAARCCRLVY